MLCRAPQGGGPDSGLPLLRMGKVVGGDVRGYGAAWQIRWRVEVYGLLGEYAAFRGRNRNHAVVAFDKSEYEITSVGADRFCRLGLSKPTNEQGGVIWPV